MRVGSDSVFLRESVSCGNEVDSGERLRDMDPRRVLLGVDLDELSDVRRSAVLKRSSERDRDHDRDRGRVEELDILEQVKHLRKTVEEDHDRRFRGIEINIRWLMVLVGGEVVAIVGFALSTLTGV